MAHQLTLNTTALEELKTMAASLPVAITVDATLTQEGQAADAKATGDALAGKAGASKEESVVVASSTWTGDTAPYVATVACTIATANNKLIVGVGGSLTAEQEAAYVAARIICTDQAAGAITLTAYGTVPEIDLPVNVLEVG